MELSPKTMDFYIDTLDRCMSDVHCPVCLIFSCDKNIVTHHNEVENVTADNGNYNIKNNVTCKWNEQLREQYTLAFNIVEIEKLHLEFKNILHKISYVTQDMINSLYTNMKNVFINPAKKTAMYI